MTVLVGPRSMVHGLWSMVSAGASLRFTEIRPQPPTENVHGVGRIHPRPIRAYTDVVVARPGAGRGDDDELRSSRGADGGRDLGAERGADQEAPIGQWQHAVEAADHVRWHRELIGGAIGAGDLAI